MATATVEVGAKITNATGSITKSAAGAQVDSVQPYICCQFLCDTQSVGWDYPNCVGCADEGVCCCCFYAKAQACRVLPENEEIVCLCKQFQCICIQPQGNRLCWRKSQCCCCEYRCGLPCSESTSPMGFTVLFMQFCQHDEWTWPPECGFTCAPRIDSLVFDAPEIPSINRL